MTNPGRRFILDKMSDWWRGMKPAWRFSLIAVTAARIFYTLWSLFFLSNFSLVVQNQEFFGEPVVAVFDLQTSRGYSYNRSVDGVTLSFRRFDVSRLIDSETGSLWQVAGGVCVGGPCAGMTLRASDIGVEKLFPYYGVTVHRAPLVSIWQRFDVNWYLAIAQRGYGTIPSDVHFPPLYSVLIRWLSFLLRDDMISGLLLSQLALYYLVVLLYELFTKWGGETTALRALLFFLIFPTSFFLFSAYTEAIFMIAAILCLRSIREEKWHWAGFWVFCAILVRLQGVALFVPLAWMVLRTRFRNMRWLDLFLAGVTSLAAVGAYLLLRAGAGDSAVIPLTESSLHARIVFPWETVFYSVRYIVSGQGGYIDILNLVVFLAFGILLAVYWKKLPVEYALFSAASIILFSMRWVDTQPLNSMIRYLLTVFPIFLLFGQFAENKWANRLMFLSFLGLNLFLCAQFFLWGWVA